MYLLALLLAGAMAVTGCATQSKVLATVNGQRISERDVIQRINLLKFITGEDNPDRDLVLRGMVEEILLLQDAAQRQLKPSAADLEQRKKEFRNILLMQSSGREQGQPGTQLNSQQFEQQLKQDMQKFNVSQADLDGFVTNLTTIQLLQQEVVKSVSVTDDDVRKLYESRKDQVKARHILVKTKEEAEKIAAEAKANPEKFGDLAAKYSTEPGAAERKGDLGAFGRGRMVKPFEDAAFAMQAGQISDPVQTQFGWHVIQVYERTTVPFEQVQKELRDEVAQQRQNEAFRKFLAELKFKAQVTPPELLREPQPQP